MTALPLLLSVPHGGTTIPVEVRPLCVLTERQVVEDGDEGVDRIYALSDHVLQHVATGVARAIVDVNRAEDDFRKDGVVKTHTCWNVPVYREAPDHALVAALIERYHRPYHQRLSAPRDGVILGVDGHTMAAIGPPVGPDAGARRPRVCLSNGDGTLPDAWFRLLIECFQVAFEGGVSANDPFGGGYIVRRHSREMPWVQVELSREPWIDVEEKRERVLAALERFASRVEPSDA